MTTADYITPPVNDPFLFGQIAAANAISDIYAMGGRPLTCLNLVSYPADKLPPETLHRIITGALTKITESGAVLAGGHTVENDEPKFGLAVTGIVHPEKYWSNTGAGVGDVLVLTKPVGIGVLLNANIKKTVSKDAMEFCLKTMTTLNKTAMEIMSDFDIHAATDITGFGLAGHGYEMASGSGSCLEICLADVPVLPEALKMYKKGVSTGVNLQNKLMSNKNTRFEIDVPLWNREIVYDPQTNGGLLVSTPEHCVQDLIRNLHKGGINSAAVIGRVTAVEDSIHLRFI